MYLQYTYHEINVFQMHFIILFYTRDYTTVQTFGVNNRKLLFESASLH